MQMAEDAMSDLLSVLQHIILDYEKFVKNDNTDHFIDDMMANCEDAIATIARHGLPFGDE